jgi:REP element-mobilizing transposase RayT
MRREQSEFQNVAAAYKSFSEPLTLFLTWTTYGNWLPGDQRGWRKSFGGPQPPQPRLDAWCRDRLREMPVILSRSQRVEVEAVVKEHAAKRGWELHAISVRSNHVQLAVTACEKPGKVRDQFKANATSRLRRCHSPIQQERIWTRGGDIELLNTEEDLEQVVIYITIAQDRMGLGK